MKQSLATNKCCVTDDIEEQQKSGRGKKHQCVYVFMRKRSVATSPNFNAQWLDGDIPDPKIRSSNPVARDKSVFLLMLSHKVQKQGF